MSLLWIIVFCVVALVWVLSIVDIVRRHYSGWIVDDYDRARMSVESKPATMREVAALAGSHRSRQPIRCRVAGRVLSAERGRPRTAHAS